MEMLNTIKLESFFVTVWSQTGGQDLWRHQHRHQEGKKRQQRQRRERENGREEAETEREGGAVGEKRENVYLRGRGGDGIGERAKMV